MYVPRAFAVTERETLYDLIEAYPFGILVDTREGTPTASHLPFTIDRTRGTLFTHVARANPQGNCAGAPQEMLAIFQGPHGYISPRWYAPGNAVPTWNYAAVHAYGTPREVTEPDTLRRQQDELVRTFEGPDGWRLDTQPPNYVTGMMQGIVAFEIPIARIEGKFKLSQNRSESDRESVIAALSLGSAWDRALAEYMREHAF